MKKGIILLMVLLVFVIAGCKSAFQLPAGCSSDSSQASASDGGQASPVPSENVVGNVSVQNVESTSLKETSVAKSVISSSDTTLSNIPVKKVTEGDLVSFPHLKAIDPDGAKITYFFTRPLDSNGKWQTKIGDAGEYVVTVTASDGQATASQKVRIIVNAKNLPPVIEPIEDVIVSEGDVVKLSPVVTDPENDSIIVSYSGWMDSDTKNTTFGDSGKYVVVITASDGVSATSRKVNIVVSKVNRAPVIEPINDAVLKEGDKMTVKPIASDPDKDKLSFTFSPPLDANGVWQTQIGDAGTYDMNVTVSDGELSDVAQFKVTVESIKRPPVLTVKEAEISVDENETVSIHAEAISPDNDSVRITYSGWMTGDTYKTNFGDAGVHTVTVTAIDGINKVSKNVQVTVRHVNRPPVFDPGSFD